MAIAHSELTPEARGRRATNKTVVRPHPTEAGVYILDRGNYETEISQGIVKMGGAITQYTLERPAGELEDQVPILYVPGYGGIKPAYRELRKATAQQGRAAVTFKPPRNQERFAGLHPRHMFHPERLLAQATIAVAQDLVRNDGAKHGYEQVDGVGHSMGGPGVTNAALVHDELFRSITLKASAGLDDHTLIDMARRMPGVVTKELFPSFKDIRVRKDGRAIIDIAHYGGRNPVRTLAEGAAVGSGDIKPKLAIVGRLGVKTAALQFEDDHFFPCAKVEAASAHLFDIFRIYPNPQANHMWPQLDPEGVAEAVVELTYDLNQAA